jgi:hypothetical protein
MVDVVRGYMLYQFLRDVCNLEGAVAEVGVWRGGTSQLMTAVLPHKETYLFDTFAGLPEISPDFDRDYHSKGQFSDTSDEDVRRLFSKQEMVKVIKGVFPLSVKDNERYPANFCFVHIDVDLYQSAKDCCEYFYQRLVPGGVMIFDDYGFGTCPGVRQAVDEFFKSRYGHFYVPTGQYVVVKRPQADKGQV